MRLLKLAILLESLIYPQRRLSWWLSRAVATVWMKYCVKLARNSIQHSVNSCQNLVKSQKQESQSLMQMVKLLHQERLQPKWHRMMHRLHLNLRRLRQLPLYRAQMNRVTELVFFPTLVDHQNSQEAQHQLQALSPNSKWTMKSLIMKKRKFPPASQHPRRLSPNRIQNEIPWKRHNLRSYSKRSKAMYPKISVTILSKSTKTNAKATSNETEALCSLTR